MKIPEEYRKLKLMELPHVVILGAGASCAATPSDEKYNRKLPLMNELPQVLDLDDLLDSEDIKIAESNFEKYYSELIELGKDDLTDEIEKRLYAYFSTIDISDELTLYEKIIFSLRRKDLIATFNWDPLLGYAFRRNGFLKTLPHVLFLHGSVLTGFCEKDKRLGWNDDICDVCKEQLQPTSLLYPVNNKDYEIDPIIREQWNILENYLSNAYFVTIFGYSAPRTDYSARRRIIDKIVQNERKSIMQIEIIDLYAKELLDGNLKELKSETHYSLLNSYEHSWMNRHPKFSCEALFEATMQQSPIRPIPFPHKNDLKQYREWIKNLNKEFPSFYSEGNSKQG